MDMPTTRRALLAGATAVAVAGVAAPVIAETPTASPDLLALVAAARNAERAADAHHRDVYVPADARRNEAVAAAQASLPHTSVDAGENVYGERIVWRTADPMSVTIARSRVADARKGAALAADHVAAARKLMAAHLRRERAIDRVRRAGDIRALAERSNALINASCEAEHAVATYPAGTSADLALKLSFMVERTMGDGVDWLPELLDDARRLAKVEG